MPLLKDLLDLYDAIEEQGYPLVGSRSVWCEPKTSDIEITIDTDGRFVRADRLERWIKVKNENGKEETRKCSVEALTPVTIYSECRTSGAAPRPLSDSGKYFMPEQAGGRYFSKTMDLLKRWNTSAGGILKLEALIRYLSAGTILKDIADSGLLDDVPVPKQEEKLRSLVVRFVISGDTPERPWEDERLISSWDTFMEKSNKGHFVKDSVSGRDGAPAHKHGKNLLPDNPNGKLISSSQFESEMLFMTGTRFTDTSQAPPVTWETSVKSHRMLRWLIANRSIVVRNSGGATYWMCFSKTGPVDIGLDVLQTETSTDTEGSHGTVFENAVRGKDFEIPKGDMTVFAMDHSSDGRDSIVYYQSVSSDIFFSNIKKWRERYRIETKSGYFSPSLYRIILHAYGHYEYETGRLVVNSAVMKTHLNRLMRCFLEGRDIPADIVTACAVNVSRTSHFPEVMAGVMQTACALIAGAPEKTSITDEEQDRDYLYGRLLAVLEWIERASVYKKNVKSPPGQKVERPTNAVRLWHAYTVDPRNISRRLHRKVVDGYMYRLSETSVDYYGSLIGSIYAGLDRTEKRAGNLGPRYLAGYAQQKEALRRRSREARRGYRTDGT